jgi:hypothetical protein
VRAVEALQVSASLAADQPVIERVAWISPDFGDPVVFDGGDEAAVREAVQRTDSFDLQGNHLWSIIQYLRPVWLPVKIFHRSFTRT